MQELMKKLRANAPEDIAGYKVESVVDYDTDGTGLPAPTCWNTIWTAGIS